MKRVTVEWVAEVTYEAELELEDHERPEDLDHNDQRLIDAETGEHYTGVLDREIIRAEAIDPFADEQPARIWP